MLDINFFCLPLLQIEPFPLMDKINTSKSIFVTVGTTLFEALIRKMDEEEILKVFIEFGYNKIIYQTGKGTFRPTNCEKIKGLEVEIFDFKPSLIDVLKSADIIVSHGGNKARENT